VRLFIAEKPSLARAIADALPGSALRRDRYLECSNGDVVAWCAGHILELAPPDAYDPDFKQWRIEHLPITPRDWKLTVTAPDLLKTIKALLPRASVVVNAGDPDREGQLLIDEVLVFLGYRGRVDHQRFERRGGAKGNRRRATEREVQAALRRRPRPPTR
jgi:DNA topoisomerase-3